MPVKGLTDQIQPKFPRLGKLRKGGEKTSSGFGPDLDFFRFTSENPEIERVFLDAYGERPRSLQVFIPYATPEEAFPVWAEIWGATGLVHRCDGQTMTIWQEAGKYNRGARPCAGGHTKDDYLNDAVGRLTLIVPGLIEAGHVGYVTLETHSKHDILGILATLHAVYDSRRGGELGLRGVMFNLRRVQESITTPGFGKQEGKRSRVNKWLVRLEPAADWVRLQIEMAQARQMQFEPGQKTLQLSSGEEADLVTGEIVDAGPPADPAWSEPEPPPSDACPNCGQTGGNHASNCSEFRKTLAGGNKGQPKAKAEPPKEPDLVRATRVKTQKGTPLGNLTDEQLDVVVKAYAKGPLTDEQKRIKAAAEYLAAKCHPADMELWSSTHRAAQKSGLAVEAVTPNMTALQVARRINETAILIAEIESAIPEEFGGAG